MKFLKFLSVGFLSLFLGAVLVVGCDKDDDSSDDEPCNYVQWTQGGSCPSGSHPVYDGKCCSAGYPYYNTMTGSCYVTCSGARSDNRLGGIYKINTSGGNTGGGLCSNTCEYAYDGECDDGGPGSMYNLCDYGTDCADCGVR